MPLDLEDPCDYNIIINNYTALPAEGYEGSGEEYTQTSHCPTTTAYRGRRPSSTFWCCPSSSVHTRQKTVHPKTPQTGKFGATRDTSLPEVHPPLDTEGPLRSANQADLAGTSPVRGRVSMAAGEHRVLAGGCRSVSRVLPLRRLSLFHSRQTSDSNASRYALD